MSEHTTTAAIRPPDKPFEGSSFSLSWFEPEPVTVGEAVDDELNVAEPLGAAISRPLAVVETEYDRVTAAPWVLTIRYVPPANVSEAL
jgi:hypothetical protein